MNSFINRETLRNDVLDYAICAGKPIYMTKHKVLEVIDNIPEGIVRCRDCKREETCKFCLGGDGFCSRGERAV